LLENPSLYNSNGITKLYGITLSGEEWRKIMAILDELLESKVVTGLAVVVGAAILAPVIVPIATGVLRPVAKSVIKGGILLYEKGRETGAELAEALEDLVAETKAEMETPAAQAATTAAAAQEVSPPAIRKE
jgi:hypothetical protein